MNLIVINLINFTIHSSFYVEREMHLLEAALRQDPSMHNNYARHASNTSKSINIQRNLS